MAITAQAGYMVDPNNPNAVVKIGSTSMPGSVQAISQSSPSISYGAVNNTQTTQTSPAYVAPAPAIQQTPTTNYTNPNPVIPDYNAITTGVLSPYTQQASDAQAQANLARKQADDQAKLIESKIAQIQGIGDFQSQLQDQAGISGQQQNVTELTARLKQLAAEQQASQIQLASQQQALAKPGVTSGVINAQSAELARQNVAMNLPKALEALTTSAQLDVAQGNLANAETKITQAVNLKYKTLTDEISARQQLYSDLSANATRSEQKVLDAKNKVLEAQKADLATKKAQQQDVLNAIQDATKSGANVSALASQVIQLDPNSATFTKDLANIQAKVPATGGKVGTGTGGTVSNYNGEFAATITQASQLLGAQKASTSTRSLQTAIANKDYKSAYTEIANNVEEYLTGTNKTRFSAARTDLGVLAGLKDVIQQYANAGGNMGYLKGTAEQIAKKFGQLKTDPKFSALATQLEREFQAYRNEMTGAAFSPGESKEYEAVNPTGNKTLDLNIATINGALAQLQNRVSSTINARVPGAQYIAEYAQGATTQPQQNSSVILQGTTSSGVGFKVIQ